MFFRTFLAQLLAKLGSVDVMELEEADRRCSICWEEYGTVQSASGMDPNPISAPDRNSCQAPTSTYENRCTITLPIVLDADLYEASALRLAEWMRSVGVSWLLSCQTIYQVLNAAILSTSRLSGQ